MAKRRLETGRVKVWSCDIIVDWADPQEEPDDDTMQQVSISFKFALNQLIRSKICLVLNVLITIFIIIHVTGVYLENDLKHVVSVCLNNVLLLFIVLDILQAATNLSCLLRASKAFL